MQQESLPHGKRFAVPFVSLSVPSERPMRTKSIFQLLTEYHTSLDNMRSWLHDSTLDEVERMGIIDAWQEEMKQYFKKHGFCFACNRPIPRCQCPEAL